MTCEDARTQLAGLALGELDAEVREELERHLADCAACRAERDPLGAAATLLRSAGELSGSTERRGEAVSAMSAEHAERVAWLVSRPRRPWLPWVAAAVLVGVLAFVLVPRPRQAYAVADVSGAQVDRGARGTWAALEADTEVLSGDRVLVPQEGLVILKTGDARITVEGDASFLVVGRRIALERGRLHAVVDGSGGTLEVSDPGNNVVRIRLGEIRARLVQVKSAVAGSRENPDTRVIPGPKVGVKQRLHVSVVAGTAMLEGSDTQRLRAETGREGTFDMSGTPGLVPANRGDR